MATSIFAYNGRDKQGNEVSGELEADNQQIVINRLRERGIMVTSIKAKPKDIELNLFPPKIETKDLAIFTRQFSTMINAGLPLVQCLNILGTQMENPTFRDVVLTIMGDVESGMTFAEALGKHPKVFDSLFVNMVMAGEIGGILDTILNRLADHIEKAEGLRRKVKAALTYPVTVLVIAFVIVVLLMVKVVPTFADMFTSFGGELPAPTQLIMTVSDFFRDSWYYMVAGIGASTYAFKTYTSTEQGAYNWDKLLLNTPGFGPMLQKVAVAKFTRTFGTLMDSGVAIIEALNITARTAGNKVIEEAVISAKNSIQEGSNIATPLRETGVFPPMVMQMINVGEETGELANMLNKIAEFYDSEVDDAVDGLTAMLEPMIMAFLGIVIGFVVVALMLPIMQMSQLVNG